MTLTVTMTDAELLAQLDFDADIRCEVLADDTTTCGDVAGWIARLRCPSCLGFDDLPLCREHRNLMLEPDVTVTGECENCGHRGATVLECVRPIR